MARYLFDFIKKDLTKKMVFLAGPRQCGKTTLAQALLEKGDLKGRYFNWDADEDRKSILKKEWQKDAKLLIFDELHKYNRWKNWIKGTFDTQKSSHQFLITGSARLDIYRKGGDSLFGRYFYWRLHPFSLCEVPEGISKEDAFQRLMTLGGFPEPFLKKDLQEARRWRRARLDQVIKQDLRDLEVVKDVTKLSLFVDLLKERVGKPISLSNLARDLEIAPKTAKHWLEVLERVYVVFVIRPFARKLSRTIVKQPKVFFYDTGDLPEDEGIRFENLVACHLLKQIQFIEDAMGYRMELRYIKDKEKREIDFVILKEGKVIELIEVKWSDTNLSESLYYYQKKFKNIKARQITGEKTTTKMIDGIELISAIDAFSNFNYVGKNEI